MFGSKDFIWFQFVLVFVQLIVLLGILDTWGVSGENPTDESKVKIPRVFLDQLDLLNVDSFTMELKINLLLQYFWNLSNDSNNETWRKFNFQLEEATERKIESNSWVEQHETLRVHRKRDKILASIPCQMSYLMFPFDNQRCYFSLVPTVDSNALSVKNADDGPMYLLGNGQSIRIDREGRSVMDIPKSRIFGSSYSIVRAFQRSSNSSSYKDEEFERRDWLTVAVHFRRLWFSYFGYYYIPMSLFVLISFLTLWLVYPKISVFINFFNGISASIFLVLCRIKMDIPNIPYVTPMSVYSSTCIIFIALVLFVNVYVLYYIKSEEEDNEEKARRRRIYDLNIRQELKYCPATSHFGPRITQNVPEEIDDPVPNLNVTAGSDGQSTWTTFKKHLLDKVRRNSHWALLSAFLIFNAIYWISLLSIHYLQ